MKTSVKVLMIAVIMVMAAFTANAGGKDKKVLAVPATEFVVIDSIEVSYNGNADFSFDSFRQAHKNRFAIWNKKVNDANLATNIQSGETVVIYLAEEKHGKIYTTEEAEKYLASQGAEAPSIAWLAIAQVQKDKSIWQKGNTICFGKEVVVHKSGAQLIPYMTADGGIALFAREYPSNNGEFVDQIAFIKK